MGFFGKLFGEAIGQVVNNVVGGQQKQQSGLATALSGLQDVASAVGLFGKTEGVVACHARWNTILPQYPRWDLPAKSMSIERLEDSNGGHFYSFETEVEHEVEMEQFRYIYCDRLREAGFSKAGKYPSEDHYYKRILGVVYHVDFEYWHENDTIINILFKVGEPEGGYDYNPTGKTTLGDVIDVVTGNQSGTQSKKSILDLLKDSL